MISKPFALYLGKKKFSNQELVYASLYNAQNLGFYKSIYADGLVDGYSETVARANIYSCASNFRQAFRVLGGNARWVTAGVSKPANQRLMVSAPSNLESLALIAEAHIQGWNLVIEDCPFTKRFIQPMARRDGRRSVFQPFNLIPKMIRAASDARPLNGCIYFTFPDRPFDSLKGSLAVTLLGQGFLLSVAEALLTRSQVDRVFRLGCTLVELEHPKGGASTITGEDLRRLTVDQAVALTEAIFATPINYLGWESLYTRSQVYLNLMVSNRLNIFRCLLRYGQLRGTPLPQSTYDELVGQLDRRNFKPAN